MSFKVQFFKGTKSQYQSITPDNYTFYYLSDTHQVFLGTIQLSNSDFSQIYAQILQLAQNLNNLETNSARVVVLTQNNTEQIESSISEQHTFYIYGLGGTSIPDIKIGDGNTPVSSLPFLSQGSVLLFESLEALLNEHIADRNLHIRSGAYLDNLGNATSETITERDKWDNRVTAYTQIKQGRTGIETQISSSDLVQIDGSNDFHLYLNNENIIVKQNIPKRIIIN